MTDSPTPRSGRLQLFGNIYATVMVLLSLFPIFWMFQFFWLVPQLRQYFVVTLLVPAMGLGVGIYGLRATRRGGGPPPPDGPADLPSDDSRTGELS